MVHVGDKLINIIEKWQSKMNSFELIHVLKMLKEYEHVKSY